MVSKISLVNPCWSFEGSIYFGCREPHLPLEFGYAKALLERSGHEVQILDGHLDRLSSEEIRKRVTTFRPDYTVITTAPSYLFWRCAPPELRVPQETVKEIREASNTLVVVGPHASCTPGPALRKLEADLAIMGEFEEVLPKLVESSFDWRGTPSVAYFEWNELRTQGRRHLSDMNSLPVLYWPMETIARHHHHHHRFDAQPKGPGAEVEASRGCPYHCFFCARDNFRSTYRKRPLSVVFEEIQALRAQGVEYVYFIDEIFMPDRELLLGLTELKIKFGAQLRIDLWDLDMLELLGRAGCVSIEAGIESVSDKGRSQMGKECRIPFDDLFNRLVFAKKHIPFVQANLIDSKTDDLEMVRQWRAALHFHGVWANKPVPLFPYPGSNAYRRLWGRPDDRAWERAHEYYVGANSEFSDIQEKKPVSLPELELPISDFGLRNAE